MDLIDEFPDVDSVEPGQDDPAVDEALEELFGKGYHEDHDQSTHGNRDGGEKTKNGRVVYHMTLPGAAEKIKSEGLKRGESWHGRPPSVFFTTDLDEAKYYGGLFAQWNRFAIVSFTMPEDAFKEAKPDEQDTQSEHLKNAWRIERDIPAEWITDVQSLKADTDAHDLLSLLKKKGLHEHTRTGYSVVFIDPPAEKKFEKRELNRYERRVDYAKIEKSLEGLIVEAGIDARRSLVAVEKRYLDLLLARMDSKLSADDVAGLRIDAGTTVLGTFDQLLHDAWRLGVEHTYHEHPGHAESVRARQFAGLEPEAAMRYFRARALDMKGIIDDDLTEATKQELLMFLKGGRSIPESIDNIRRIFEPFVGDPTKIQPSGQIGIGFPPGDMGPENVLMAYRLENIIRTPTTEAYNQGRLAVGDEMEEFVVGYAYSAILDERTTEICQFLDQFMVRKDDPALRKLTPPNHFQCRSILVFITQEDLPVEFTDPETIEEGIRIVQTGFK